MSLLDDHDPGGEGEVWAVPSDPEDEAPARWPNDGEPEPRPT